MKLMRSSVPGCIGGLQMQGHVDDMQRRNIESHEKKCNVDMVPTNNRI